MILHGIAWYFTVLHYLANLAPSYSRVPINSRVPTPTWNAGRTSLIGESFSEVLAYRMGEIPANDLERSGDRTAVRDFLKEVDDKASAFTIGKKRKKETWVIFLVPLAGQAGPGEKPKATHSELYSTI